MLFSLIFAHITAFLVAIVVTHPHETEQKPLTAEDEFLREFLPSAETGEIIGVNFLDSLIKYGMLEMTKQSYQSHHELMKKLQPELYHQNNAINPQELAIDAMMQKIQQSKFLEPTGNRLLDMLDRNGIPVTNGVKQFTQAIKNHQEQSKYTREQLIAKGILRQLRGQVRRVLPKIIKDVLAGQDPMISLTGRNLSQLISEGKRIQDYQAELLTGQHSSLQHSPESWIKTGQGQLPSPIHSQLITSNQPFFLSSTADQFSTISNLSQRDAAPISSNKFSPLSSPLNNLLRQRANRSSNQLSHNLHRKRYSPSSWQTTNVQNYGDTREMQQFGSSTSSDLTKLNAKSALVLGLAPYDFAPAIDANIAEYTPLASNRRRLQVSRMAEQPNRPGFLVPRVIPVNHQVKLPALVGIMPSDPDHAVRRNPSSADAYLARLRSRLPFGVQAERRYIPPGEYRPKGRHTRLRMFGSNNDETPGVGVRMVLPSIDPTKSMFDSDFSTRGRTITDYVGTAKLPNHWQPGDTLGGSFKSSTRRLDSGTARLGLPSVGYDSSIQ